MKKNYEIVDRGDSKSANPWKTTKIRGEFQSFKSYEIGWFKPRSTRDFRNHIWSPGGMNRTWTNL